MHLSAAHIVIYGGCLFHGVSQKQGGIILGWPLFLGAIFFSPGKCSIILSGMAKDFSDSFYHSAKWQRCRAAYLAEHPYCERCLKIGRVVPAEHVHHRIVLNPSNISDPDVTLNPDHLEALCEPCHSREHNAKSEINSNLFFDSDGNIKQRPDVRKQPSPV